jgi:signal transduction histidine kinase
LACLVRELHDSITQSLYGLTLFTRSSHDAQREGNQEKLVASLEQIEANARIALKEIRLLLFQMQPQGLEAGFLNGINARFDLVERRLGVKATCQVNEQISLSSEIEAAQYRIALKALNNSLKHAQAGHVHITLTLFSPSTRSSSLMRFNRKGLRSAGLRARSPRTIY